METYFFQKIINADCLWQCPSYKSFGDEWWVKRKIFRQTLKEYLLPVTHFQIFTTISTMSGSVKGKVKLWRNASRALASEWLIYKYLQLPRFQWRHLCYVRWHSAIHCSVASKSLSLSQCPKLDGMTHFRVFKEACWLCPSQSIHNQWLLAPTMFQCSNYPMFQCFNVPMF